MSKTGNPFISTERGVLDAVRPPQLFRIIAVQGWKLGHLQLETPEGKLSLANLKATVAEMGMEVAWIRRRMVCQIGTPGGLPVGNMVFGESVGTVH